MTHRAYALFWVAIALCVMPHSVTAASSVEGQQRVERFLQGLKGLRADFTQTLSDRTGQVTDTSTGTLSILRPDRFRWDYRSPYEQLIVSDGTRVWVYDADLEQVTVRKLDVALSSTPAMLLSGQGTLADNFEVTETLERGGIIWVRMQPKRNDTDFRSVSLGFGGAQAQQLQYMELADKLGQTTLLELKGFERNPSLDPKLFVFDVPEGADVIGDPGATGSRSADR